MGGTIQNVLKFMIFFIAQTSENLVKNVIFANFVSFWDEIFLYSPLQIRHQSCNFLKFPFEIVDFIHKRFRAVAWANLEEADQNFRRGAKCGKINPLCPLVGRANDLSERGHYPQSPSATSVFNSL